MESLVENIIRYAGTVEQFTAVQYAQDNGIPVESPAQRHTILNTISRLVCKGKLQTVRKGLYAQSNLSPWQVVLTPQEKAVYDSLQSQFPLLKICTYNGETFAPLQQPVFEQLRGGMMATIQREVFLKIRGAQSVIAGTEQPIGNDTGNDTGNDRGNDLGKIKLIVCSLNREILRREELMTRMKLRSSSNYRDQYLYPAMAAGYVAMTLPYKPQSKNQKYYLTPKGIELLKQLNAN